MEKDSKVTLLKQIQSAVESDPKCLGFLESFWSEYQKGNDNDNNNDSSKRKSSGKNLPNIEAFTELLDEISSQKSHDEDDDTDVNGKQKADPKHGLQQSDFVLLDIPNNNHLSITFSNENDSNSNSSIHNAPRLTFRNDEARLSQNETSNTLSMSNYDKLQCFLIGCYCILNGITDESLKNENENEQENEDDNKTQDVKDDKDDSSNLTTTTSSAIVIPPSKEMKTENNDDTSDDVAITTVKTVAKEKQQEKEKEKEGEKGNDKTPRFDMSLSVNNIGEKSNSSNNLTPRSREASMTPLGVSNSVDARIEFLENEDVVFRLIFQNIAKYFNEKDTKIAQRELSDIWIILKEGINDNTLNGLLARLAVILFVNEENLVKLSFVENSSDVDGISQIKHKLDSSLFSQMVLKIGCFMDIYNDMKKESADTDGKTADEKSNKQEEKQGSKKSKNHSNVLLKFMKYYYYFENNKNSGGGKSEDSSRKEHFLLAMHNGENGDTLFSVAKENEDAEFEKILLKYMVSSEVINDILTKHSNYIYGAMRELRTKMTKDDKQVILNKFYRNGYLNKFFNEKNKVCGLFVFCFGFQLMSYGVILGVCV